MPKTGDTVFFDLETQKTFAELGTGFKEPEKLKLAVAGVLSNKKTLFFNENQIFELLKILNNASLIVGHNLLGFDYLVLEPYASNIMEILKPKTFDIMYELEKLIGRRIGLDDLGKRNVGMTKSIVATEIPKMWREGKHDEVNEYLLNDLKMTEAIFNHGKNVKKFKYELKVSGVTLGEKEVSVDW